MEYLSLLDPVCKIAESAAEFIKSNFGKVTHDLIEHKSLNSLVSFVDKGAEEIIVTGLKDLLPDSTFLTEEETVDQKKSKVQWIVDPLDGTTNFLHGLPLFSVSIALEIEGVVVLGVVVEVNNGFTFKASRKGGAFLNNKKISVSKTTKLQDSLVATGFPYHDFGMLEQYLNALKELMKNTRGIRRYGSAAVDLCFVACGKFDAFFEYGLNPWDVAAGMLIIEEAGGRLTDFNDKGTHYLGKEIIASNRGIFDEFSLVVQQHLKH